MTLAGLVLDGTFVWVCSSCFVAIQLNASEESLSLVSQDFNTIRGMTLSDVDNYFSQCVLYASE